MTKISGLIDGGLRMESILFATDFSPASGPAAFFATAMAAHFHSVLTLVHVFLPTQSAQEAEARDGVKSDQRLQIEQKLAQTTQALAPRGGTARSLLLEGDPSLVLAREANQSQGAMLVLGTHGGSNIGRRVLGSVAESALRGSAIPTLTVGHRVPVPSGEPLFQRILYATDASPMAAHAAPWACAFAKSFNSRLEVVSVIDEDAGPVDRIVAELDFRTQQELTANLVERCVHFESPRGVAYSKHAHDEILHRLERDNCDLLVLGIEQTSRVGFRDRNSGAFRIIAEAPCPVLTITGHALQP
jgi:nucleotide-binding universal stress UspA family protein